MAWTYSGDPKSSAKDEVRYLVGDTDSTDQLLQDEEIAYELGEPNVAGDLNVVTTMQAAVSACRAIAAKFSRLADASFGSTRVSYSQKSKSYLDLADRLSSRSRRPAIHVYAGGTSYGDKQVAEQDPDRIPTAAKNETDAWPDPRERPLSGPNEGDVTVRI